MSGTTRTADELTLSPAADAPDLPAAPAPPGSPPGTAPPDSPPEAAPAARHAQPGDPVVERPGALAALARHADHLVLGALTLVVTLVHTIGVLDFPTLADDEGTYTAQADAVRVGELAHYTYWYDHPPLGWIQLGALDWIPRTLLDVQPVAATRLVMVLAASLAAALTYLIARRTGFGRSCAALATLLAFCSPLAVTVQRQVYLDNIAAPWVLLSLWLALDPRRRLWQQVAAGAVFAVAVLSKETVLVLLPVVLWAVVRTADRRIRPFAVAGAAGAAALGIVAYPLLALLRNELLPGAGHVSLWDAMVYQTVGRSGSGQLWDGGSAARAVLGSWLYYDPWIIVLGLCGLPVMLLVPRLRVLGVALLVVVLVGIKPGGYLPAMYIVMALPLLGLSAAGALDQALVLLRRLPPLAPLAPLATARRAGVLAPVVVGAAAAALVVPWWPGLHDAATTRTNDERSQAEAWLVANVPSRSVLLLDDVSWVAVSDRGVVPRPQAVWFYKLDTDPAVAKLLPHGWRDVTYLVSTDQMRLSLSGDPGLRQARAAMTHSVPVATFGSGSSAVEVRRVQVDDPAEATP